MCPKRRVILQTLSLLSTSCLLAFAFASTPPNNNIVTTVPSENNRHCSADIVCILSNLPNASQKQPGYGRYHWPLAAFHQKRQYYSSKQLQHRNFLKGQRGYYIKREKEQETMCRPMLVLSATKRNQSPRGGGGSRARDGEALLPQTTNQKTKRENTESSSLLSQIQNANYNTFSSITKTITSSKKAQGRAMLLLVSFLYGTLNVTLRGVYATDGAPVASVLSLVRQCLSIVTFIPILWSVRNSKQQNNGKSMDMVLEEGNGGGKEGTKEITRPMWMAALELAFWNFGAQGLINAGLLYSPAARAAFLTQTSVVMTPLISAVAGESIKSSVWGGCALALTGLALISTSHTPEAAVDVAASMTGDGMDAAGQALTDIASSAISLNQGDFLILAGALSWSTYIFRTSSIAKSYSEIDLQFTKTVLLAVMYGGWFLTNVASSLTSAAAAAATSVWSLLSSGAWLKAIASLWSGWYSLPVWILLAYSAVGPGAVADLLQQTGQKEVSASESNIILCLESLFAAVCAFIFLGEVSSMQEMVGGLLIVLAAVLASR